MLKLSDIPSFIEQNLPHMVDLPKNDNRITDRAKIKAAVEWCMHQYGQMAIVCDGSDYEWRLVENAKGDMLGETFRFREQRDAAVFRMFWG